ncbi:MAG: hypothetical protein M3067_13540 [Chloroflexota bacterium]|nr:hypothetical protein [Chloroflexota bacterium]
MVRKLAGGYSVWSRFSFLSIGSLLSAGSIVSIGSAGSILSLGSAGSILSIGSAGGLLSIGGRSLLAQRPAVARSRGPGRRRDGPREIRPGTVR